MGGGVIYNEISAFWGISLLEAPMARPLMSDSFNGYHVWLGIPVNEQPPNHYRLLGISIFETDRDVIEHAADRQMAHVRTFQSGRHGSLSQQILNELAAASV